MISGIGNRAFMRNLYFYVVAVCINKKGAFLFIFFVGAYTNPI